MRGKWSFSKRIKWKKPLVLNPLNSALLWLVFWGKNWISFGTIPEVLFKGNFYIAFWCLVEYMQHWHWYKLFGAAQFTLWSIHIEHCTLSWTRCCIALFTLFSNYAIFIHPIDKYFVSNVHSFMYVCNQAMALLLKK